MSQRLLVTIFTIALVASIGISAAISSGITSAMIANTAVAGPSGPAGADGRDGAVGPQGVPGADGQDGAAGTNGTGTTGKTGATGATGAPGLDATATPPITFRTGAYSATASSGTTLDTTGSGLDLPSGSYAVSIVITGALSSLTSDGTHFDSAICYMSLGGTYTEIALSAPAWPADITGSALVSLPGTQTAALKCFIGYVGGTSVDVVLAWDDLTIQAVRLD